MGVITCFLIHGWESLWYKHVILLIKWYFSNYWITPRQTEGCEDPRQQMELQCHVGLLQSAVKCPVISHSLHSTPRLRVIGNMKQRETSNQQDLFSCRLWPGLTLAGAARHHLLLPPAGTSRVSAQKLSPLTYRENRFVFLIKKNNTKRDHWGWIPLQLRTSRPHL